MSRMTLNTESRTSFADTESVVSHHVESMVDNTPRYVLSCLVLDLNGKCVLPVCCNPSDSV